VGRTAAKCRIDSANHGRHEKWTLRTLDTLLGTLSVYLISPGGMTDRSDQPHHRGR